MKTMTYRLALLPLAAVLTLGSAEQGAAQEAETLEFRFAIDPAAFAQVENSAELIDVLKAQMRIDARAPENVDMPVEIRGYAGEAESSNVARFSYTHRVGLVAGARIEDHSWADAIRETHEDLIGSDDDIWHETSYTWTEPGDEAATWDKLVRALDIGLARSSDAFGKRAAGEHQPLRVTDVEIVEFSGADQLTSEDGVSIWDCCDGYTGLSGPVLMFRPEPALRNWDGKDAALNAVIIHVAATEPPPPPPGPDSSQIAAALTTRACQGLGEGGSARIEIGERLFEGTAVMRPFQDGMTLISAGSVVEGAVQPEWCLALVAFGAMDAPGEIELVDPGTWFRSKNGATVSFLNAEGGLSRLYPDIGIATIAPGTPLKVSFKVKGMMTDEDGAEGEARMTGMIEAMPAE
jgi:hypothetical protein